MLESAVPRTRRCQRGSISKHFALISCVRLRDSEELRVSQVDGSFLRLIFRCSYLQLSQPTSKLNLGYGADQQKKKQQEFGRTVTIEQKTSKLRFAGDQPERGIVCNEPENDTNRFILSSTPLSAGS